MPLAAIDQSGKAQPRVHVDARCVYPHDPNPMTGVYGIAAPVSSQLTTQIANGTEVALICYTEGRAMHDVRGNVSSIWLEVEPSSTVAGYIPDVNVGGGYTRRQLRGLGLSQCRWSTAYGASARCSADGWRPDGEVRHPFLVLPGERAILAGLRCISGGMTGTYGRATALTGWWTSGVAPANLARSRSPGFRPC
jgi:hypothetical protein